ncbi:MAG: hypothetical protein ACXAC7_16570 [Candidatus Hodarchaeales archaeon]|jgi:hypothetical protein
MKIEKVTVRRGRKINLGNYESSNLEIGMDIILGDGDDPQETINGIHRLLNQHLEVWENQQKETIEQRDNQSQPVEPAIQTADSFLENQENIKSQEIPPTKITNISKTEKYICPKCNEVMVQKEGKEYLMCNKHWAYPDMILKGEVRDKTF